MDCGGGFAKYVLKDLAAPVLVMTGTTTDTENLTLAIKAPGSVCVLTCLCTCF